MLCKVKKCCFKWIFIDSFSSFNVYQLWEHLLEQIINDKSNHPYFKCVKKMDSQISNLITHDNMIHLQNWVFIKSTSPKHVIFWKIMQITPYSISNNYKLSIGSSITLFRCNPIIWKPHQCAHDLLNSSSCLWIWIIHVMDQFPKWHLSWIVHEIFYIPIITPYDIC